MMTYFLCGVLLGIFITTLGFLLWLKKLQQKIAYITKEANTIQDKYQQEVSIKSNETERLKNRIEEISRNYNNELVDQSNFLQNKHRQEADKIRKEYQSRIDNQNEELITLKGRLIKISDDHEQDLLNQAKIIKAEYEKIIDENLLEIYRLKQVIKQDENNSLVLVSKELQVNQIQSPQDMLINTKNLIEPISRQTYLLIKEEIISNNLPDYYSQLQTYLISKEWQKADEETVKILSNLTSAKNSYLTLENYRSIPLKELFIIDGIWSYYSNNIFGLSTQYQIYQDIYQKQGTDLEKWRQFGDLVGWRKHQKWVLNGNDITITLNKQQGTYPFLTYWKGVFLGEFMDGQSDRFTGLISRFVDVIQ